MEGQFRGSAAVAAGLVTRDCLYGPRFRRLFPDVDAPAAAEPDLLLRSRAAGVYVGIALTTAVRTAYDLGRRPDRAEAVVAIDALARGRFPLGSLLELAAGHRGDRGLVALRDCGRAGRLSLRLTDGDADPGGNPPLRAAAAAAAVPGRPVPARPGLSRDPAGDRVRRPGPPHRRTCSARPTPRGLPDSPRLGRAPARHCNSCTCPTASPASVRGGSDTSTTSCATSSAMPTTSSATSSATSWARSWARFSTVSPAGRCSWPWTSAAGAARRPSRNGSWRGCKARPSCTPTTSPGTTRCSTGPL